MRIAIPLFLLITLTGCADGPDPKEIFLELTTVTMRVTDELRRVTDAESAEQNRQRILQMADPLLGLWDKALKSPGDSYLARNENGEEVVVMPPHQTVYLEAARELVDELDRIKTIPDAWEHIKAIEKRMPGHPASKTGGR